MDRMLTRRDLLKAWLLRLLVVLPQPLLRKNQRSRFKTKISWSPMASTKC